MKHSSFDATISALSAEMSALSAATSATVRSYRRYRCGVFDDCGVGITPQMCNRVTNHGDMVLFPNLSKLRWIAFAMVTKSKQRWFFIFADTVKSQLCIVDLPGYQLTVVDHRPHFTCAGLSKNCQIGLSDQCLLILRDVTVAVSL